MGGTNDNRKSGAEAAEKMTEAEVKRVTSELQEKPWKGKKLQLRELTHSLQARTEAKEK